MTACDMITTVERYVSILCVLKKVSLIVAAPTSIIFFYIEV
jgi:hypothetical protein